jgi:hypothetical protein
MVGTSVDTDIPVKENCVRGELITAVHLFEPVAGDATKTHYQIVLLYDPKGAIPSPLVNAFLGKRAEFYGRVRDKINESS